MTDNNEPEAARCASSALALRLAFGTTNPKICILPHCIFPATKANLRTVVEVVGGPIGVWGNCRPLVDASGDAYLPPWDDPMIDAQDFKFWELPRNQEVAMDHGNRLPDFIAVIAANTPEHLLSRMYGSDVGEDQYEYNKCIQLLADWVDELGWAYVPLEYEAVFAMFVTAARERALVNQVKARLEANGTRPVFDVAFINGEWTWNGPDYLDPEAVEGKFGH